MSNIYLITGFENWGKTFLIQGLFNGRSRFYRASTYSYSGFDFCVQSQSNDDLGKSEFERRITDRRNILAQNGVFPTHIMATFCPTKESYNDSLQILNNLFSNDRIFIIPIEYKWCTNAKLIIPNIQAYYSQPPNVSVHPLTERNNDRKINKLNALLQPLL